MEKVSNQRLGSARLYPILFVRPHRTGDYIILYLDSVTRRILGYLFLILCVECYRYQKIIYNLLQPCFQKHPLLNLRMSIQLISVSTYLTYIFRFLSSVIISIEGTYPFFRVPIAVCGNLGRYKKIYSSSQRLPLTSTEFLTLKTHQSMPKIMSEYLNFHFIPKRVYTDYTGFLNGHM